MAGEEEEPQPWWCWINGIWQSSQNGCEYVRVSSAAAAGHTATAVVGVVVLLKLAWAIVWPGRDSNLFHITAILMSSAEVQETPRGNGD